MPAEDAPLWLEMSREAFEAARESERAGRYRSAVSRYYYSAFQAATALLHRRGYIAPLGREAWSHQATPDLMRESLIVLRHSEAERRELVLDLVGLYDLRIRADYGAATSLLGADVVQSRVWAEHVRDVCIRAESEVWP